MKAKRVKRWSFWTDWSGPPNGLQLGRVVFDELAGDWRGQILATIRAAAALETAAVAVRVVEVARGESKAWVVNPQPGLASRREVWLEKYS